jgi:DNA-binding CsgD family transcriptional regulator
MLLTPELIASLIDEIIQSASSPLAWRRFLTHLGDCCGSNQIFLLQEDTAVRKSALPSVPLTQMLQPPTPHNDAQPDRVQTLFWDSPAHALHCQPASAATGPHGSGGLILQRSCERGPFDPAVPRLLNMLQPHLQRASAQAPLSESDASIGCFPDLLDAAVIRLDITGAVLTASASALSLLEHGGLQLDGSRLRTTLPAEMPKLQAMLESALRLVRDIPPPPFPRPTAAAPTPRFSSAALFTRESGTPLIASIIATPAGTLAPGAGAGALVFLADHTRRASSRAAQLRALYRLSPTEIRLVDELICGKKLKLAARDLRITENTARFHVKEVFRKMGVNSQTALLRSVLTMPSVADPFEDTIQPRVAREHERTPAPVPSPQCTHHTQPTAAPLQARTPAAMRHAMLRARTKSPGELRLMAVLAAL